MAQRRFHYEQAFEHYLRANRVPYIAVDEARKALLPHHKSHAADSPGSGAGGAIKSFDFVVYAPQRNLLVDVKGRMYGAPHKATHKATLEARPEAPPLQSRVAKRRKESMWGDRLWGDRLWGGRFESWVTMDDVDGLRRWQELFGREFEATFVFIYCLRRQPPDALFEEVYMWGGRWYALREVPLAEYVREMTPRSAKWRTVHVPADAFSRISRPFSARQGAPLQTARSQANTTLF